MVSRRQEHECTTDRNDRHFSDVLYRSRLRSSEGPSSSERDVGRVVTREDAV